MFAHTISHKWQEMVHHTQAVGRGAKSPLLVADMPFGSYHVTSSQAKENAVRLIKEGAADVSHIYIYIYKI